MKNKHFIWICAILLALASSCQKEFNPRDKYKDITIVYGLINPLDSVHYIRIHKAFLTSEDVVVVAQDPAQTNFPVEDIDVRIYEITPAGNTTQISVDTVTINKNDGYFYASKQMVYYFKKTFDIQKLDNTIKIEVEHKKTGKIVYAETPIVNDFNVNIPRPGANPNFNPVKSLMHFEWNNAKNGRIYDSYYTMYYREGLDINLPNVWKKDSMVWNIGSCTSVTTGNGEEQPVTFRFYSTDFYEEIKKTIAYIADAWRRPYIRAKLTIWCGSEAMYHYNYINGTPRPTPDIPEYTNLRTKLNSEEIENEAFGIFTSRFVKHVDICLSDYMMMRYLPNKELVNRQFIPVPVIAD